MLSLDIARPEERPILENLFQLYIHDFSEQWAGRDDGELGDDGRFEDYPHLASYWRDADRVPLLIRVNGHLAGFALLNSFSHAGAPLDRAMAEFFVVRKHRRAGVGLAAAQTIFRRWPGRCEAAVARTNGAALAFWRKAVATCPGVSDIREVDVADEVWNGPVLLFSVGV